MADEKKPAGPDLTKGVPLSSIRRWRLAARPCRRRGGAAGAARRGGLRGRRDCTHYHGPLAEGVVADGTVRCPWHHACFDLRTGEALHAPALEPVACWQVEQQGGTVIVRDKIEQPKPRAARQAVGARRTGSSSSAAARPALRRPRCCAAQGYQGSITMLSNDDAPPVDRPNLSKDYLAGSAPEDWLPLRPDDFYQREPHRSAAEHRGRARSTRAAARSSLEDGSTRALRPRCCSRPAPSRCGCRSPAPTCRTSTRCARSPTAAPSSRRRTARKRAVVIGASFIGLEVAASLRARKLEVHVVAPEKRPLERVLGPQMGDFIRKLHEEHGVSSIWKTPPRRSARSR